MDVSEIQVRSILTRTSGYLTDVSSHTLQPYRGCGLGHSMCGIGCYVRHNPWVTRGRTWGDFVEARTNAADVYLKQYERELTWARRHAGRFGIFLSSSSEPFQPAEEKFGVTRSLLRAMLDRPPDRLILQTHTDKVIHSLDILSDLQHCCDLRVHISVETDREAIPGLPKSAASVARRIDAGRRVRGAGIRAVATVAPLLPIEHPERFFRTLADAFDAIVIDHFIGGDGSTDGRRTRRTALPQLMARVDPASVNLAYRDQMVEIARSVCPNVGVGPPGFAGRYLEPQTLVPIHA